MAHVEMTWAGIIWLQLFLFLEVNALNDFILPDTSKNRSVIQNDESTCYLDGKNTCWFFCVYGNDIVLNTELEKVYNEHACIMNVIITASVKFSDSIIRAHWLTANVRVALLELDAFSIKSIEANAFESQALKNLTSLKLKNLQFNLDHNQIFNGLSSLTGITLHTRKFIDFSLGLLSPIAETLRFLEVLENTQSNENMIVDNLTGANDMKALDWVSFEINLKDSLTSKTFTGISNVQYLVLSNCRIEVIGEHAFRPISRTLSYLRLDNNKLKTLPIGIFSYLLPSSIVNIYLYDNPWNCDCDLLEFQRYLILYRPNIIGTLVCKTPSAIANTDLEFADICVPDTSTTTTAIQKSTLMFFCYASSNKTYVSTFIYVNLQDIFFNISRIGIGDIVLRGSFNDTSINFVYKWLDNNLPLTTSYSCINKIESTVVLTKLPSSRAYTFCAMHAEDGMTSPLNCRTYFLSLMYDSVWVWQSSKWWFLCLSIFWLLLSVLFGFIVGYFILRQYPTILKPDKRYCTLNWIKNIFIKQKQHSMFRDGIQQRETATGSALQIEIVGCQLNEARYFNENIPTLPPRPSNKVTLDGINDHYYSHIDYHSSILNKERIR